MGNSAVKNIVLVLVLIVFSVLIGSQISGGIQDSFGAFALIAIVVVSFVMLWLGERSWHLLYYLPPALVYVPKFGGSSLPLGYALSFCVFIVGLLMSSMGRINMRWRFHAVADTVVFLMVLVVVWSYIQYPVSIRAFDADAEYVGGKEYVWAICAVSYYIALSYMSGNAADIVSTVKKSFYVLCASQGMIVAAAFWMTRGIHFGQRYEIFSFLACPLLYFVYCSASVGVLLRSPKHIMLGLLALLLILLNGRREVLAYTGEAIIYASILKRELLGLVTASIAVYVVVFALGAAGAWNDAPYSLQRVLTLLPGVKVSGGAVRETSGSSKTRRMIWEYAFDTRYGRIKDYVWGDGLQASTKDIDRMTVSTMRGRKTGSAQDAAFALASGTNTWHNGWLNTIKAIGFVGLAAVNLVFICGLVMLAKVSAAYRYHGAYPHLMALCLVYAQYALSFIWGTQTLVTFFQTFQQLAMIKLLYCAAREQNLLVPLFQQHHYVPLMIRETQQPGNLAA